MRLSNDTTHHIRRKLWFKECSMTTKNYFGQLSSHLYIFQYYYHTHTQIKKVQETNAPLRNLYQLDS